MSRSRTISTASALVAGLVIPLVGIGVASAAPVHWQRSVFPYGPEASFCDGLTQQGVDTGRFRMVPRDGIGHYEAASKFVETWTNLDTGDFVTVKGSYKEHTLHATIDSDGIVTALSSGPGTATVYDSDGHMLAHWAGSDQGRLRGRPDGHSRRPGRRRDPVPHGRQADRPALRLSATRSSRRSASRFTRLVPASRGAADARPNPCHESRATASSDPCAYGRLLTTATAPRTAGMRERQRQ